MLNRAFRLTWIVGCLLAATIPLASVIANPQEADAEVATDSEVTTDAALAQTDQKDVERSDEAKGATDEQEPEAARELDANDVRGPDAFLGQQFKKALVIELEGPIFGKFHWFLNNRLDLAKKNGVDLVILNLTTPGGDLDFSLRLARRLRDLTWAKSVIFVPEETISGGAIISLGADRIYMQQGALIGDAGPIRMGADGQFQHAEEKVVSYLAGAIRELAVAKDRPGAIAEAMVDRSLVVLEARDENGNIHFIKESEVEENLPAGWEVQGQVAETGQNRFLTVDAARAVELQIAEGVFQSEDDLLASMSIEKLSRTELTWIDQTVFILNSPVLTALLLIAGLVGLYIEIAAPGISVAGLTAMVCFGLFFWSHVLGGTSGWLEILLFVLGLVCLVCEIFVLPGFGVFGVSGAVLVVLSLVMASQDFVVPETAAEWTQLRVNFLVVLGSVFGVMLLLVGQLLLLDSLPGLNRFRLGAPEVPAVESSTGVTSLVRDDGIPRNDVTLGAGGIADSDLRPSGKVLIDGALVDVVTEGDYVQAGTEITVVKIEGNRIVVRRS